MATRVPGESERLCSHTPVPTLATQPDGGSRRDSVTAPLPGRVSVLELECLGPRCYCDHPTEVDPDPAFGIAATTDLDFMQRALELAREASRLGEVPVGAVVVSDGAILAQAFNLRETLHDPTAHAECLALTLAGRTLRTWNLSGCSLYVTLEPCPMCAGAIVLSRIKRLVYGAADRKMGACRSLYRLADDPRLNHRTEVVSGVLEAGCREMMQEFFQARRREGQTETR